MRTRAAIRTFAALASGAALVLTAPPALATGDHHGPHQGGGHHSRPDDPDKQHGRPGDHHGKPGNHHGKPGNHHGKPGNHHGKPGNHHGKPGNHHGKPGNHHGKPDKPGHHRPPPSKDCCEPVTRWQEIWRDDFSGPADSGLDTGKWIYDLGTCYPGCPAPSWGTGEVTSMTDSPQNVALDGNGNLVITPLRDDGADPTDLADDVWTSGRIETNRSDFEAPDGGALRVSGRIKLPRAPMGAAQGYLSAFWMLGGDFRAAGYRDPTGAGDLDIMEHLNGQPKTYGVAHCSPIGTVDPCNEIPDNIGLAGTTECPPRGCLSGFHTFAIELHRECSPQRIDWLVDGRVYHSVRQDQPEMTPEAWERMVNRGFFVLLNLSIGGTWPGDATSSTQPGSPFVIDNVVVSVAEPRSSGGGHRHRPRPPRGD